MGVPDAGDRGESILLEGGRGVYARSLRQQEEEEEDKQRRAIVREAGWEL